MCRESSNSQYLQYRNTSHAKASPILKPVGFKKYFLMTTVTFPILFLPISHIKLQINVLLHTFYDLFIVILRSLPST